MPHQNAWKMRTFCPHQLHMVDDILDISINILHMYPFPFAMTMTNCRCKRLLLGSTATFTIPTMIMSKHTQATVSQQCCKLSITTHVLCHAV